MNKIASFLLIFVCLSCLFGCGDVQESGEYPKVTIIEPTKTKYSRGDNIAFVGNGEDKAPDGADDGKIVWKDIKIMGNDLVWGSNIDGQIGIGESFEVDDLSVGKHEITLTGKGYNKVEASTSINILVE
jgi:hypothetical protein